MFVGSFQVLIQTGNVLLSLLKLLLQLLDRSLLRSDVLVLYLALLRDAALLRLQLGDGVLQSGDFTTRLLVLGL